ncbi:RNA polymerase sigma factor [Polyangium aurulentum]|uniref:RNA polymerase sigma factor n=1 Tax=Polyangium aurulentum TaxID=2567896 RepID=UPI0010AE73BA|nr:sigma-70 family RNA polymerase sigma factor [Polyangium aurulentum]UQA62799.1 sigma-70 family RNA polymerase sigma factor [Polyangium aurulentum]
MRNDRQDQPKEMRIVDRQTPNDDLGRYTEHMRARAGKLGVDEADIEDVVADALVVACQQKQGRPPPEEVGRVILWLLALVEQQVKAYWTRQSRGAREPLMEDPATVERTAADERDPIGTWDLQDWILKAIPKVPEPLCSVVLACDAQGDKVPAFAKKHGTNPKTVETWLHRGRIAFREALRNLDKPRRRSGVLLPFGLDLGLRPLGLLRRAMQLLGSSLRLLPNVAVAVALLAVTPSPPRASAREPDRSASTWEPVQIHAEPPPEPRPALPAPRSQEPATRAQSPAPRIPSATKSRPQQRAPMRADPDCGSLMAIKAALRRGDFARARALLDAGGCAADATERAMLGSTARR